MPSPLKDRPTGRLGRLLAALRPARAGPLPVQTGFPTSLADLVVKNHGRLKKSSSSSASSRHKKCSHSPSPSPSSPASPPPPPVAAVSQPTQPKPDLLPARATRRHKVAAFGLGLGFLALGGVASLALLVIWNKKVVVAVTVAFFSLFLLESLGSSRAPRRPRPRPRAPDATTKLDLDGRGCVSPIREVGPETETPRTSCSDSGKGSEIGNNLSDPKAKKISWRKLIAKKLQKGKKSKEVDSSSSCHGKSNRVQAELDVLSMEMDSSGSCRANRNVMDAEVDSNARYMRIEPSVDLTDETCLELRIEEEGGERAFPLVVVVAVILLGLVSGKLPAVGLTVLCFGFFCSIQRLPGNGGAVPGR